MSIFNDPRILPGKSLDQPYAGLVRLKALGHEGKDIETRKSGTTYRGPLVVLASKKRDEALCRAFRDTLIARGVPAPIVDEAFALSGVAVALCRVAAVRKLVAEDQPRSWFFDPKALRQAWILEALRPLEPFTVRGIPGFTKVDRAQVRSALRCGCVRPFEIMLPYACARSDFGPCTCCCHLELRSP